EEQQEVSPVSGPGLSQPAAPVLPRLARAREFRQGVWPTRRTNPLLELLPPRTRRWLRPVRVVVWQPAERGQNSRGRERALLQRVQPRFPEWPFLPVLQRQFAAGQRQVSLELLHSPVPRLTCRQHAGNGGAIPQSAR